MTDVALRPPDQVMRLERMGAAHQTRLSFMRQLLRRMQRERWRFERVRFDVDRDGVGTSVYTAHGPDRSYSLIAFTHDISAEERTDRVIADVWDATFSLFDGIPDDKDIARLRANTPKQEAGRFRSSELVLARANKSMRLFEHVVSRLAEGRQPDRDLLAGTGYLMRTTAVYGSGKFGCADRGKIAGRTDLAAPFQAEMLTVYLIRWFAIDLVNHVARGRGGDRAIALDPGLARNLGIGNATGLGMAPFLVKYPTLIHNWVAARETALARIRRMDVADKADRAAFLAHLDRAIDHMNGWRVDDARQMARIEDLRRDLDHIRSEVDGILDQSRPWDALYWHVEKTCTVEAQELVVSLLIEIHGDVVDDLADGMSCDHEPQLHPGMSLADLIDLIETHYGWALALDYADPETQARFWYYSEDKLEPRLGDRFADHGAELEMPLAIGRDVAALKIALEIWNGGPQVADFLLAHPDFRQIVRRVQAAPEQPYGEIRDNLLASDVRPIDVLRFKLAFFGVSRFDPKSDLWTRVNMYQGAPLPPELGHRGEGGIAFPAAPTDGSVAARHAS